MRSHVKTGLAASMALILVAFAMAATGEDAAYVKAIETWRAERQARLESDGSWLTVAGLFWLRRGENTVGSGPTNDFVLPEKAAPSRVGSFTYDDSGIGFRAAEGVALTMDGEPVTTAKLEIGEDHAIRINDRLSMWLHFSGERMAIRLRDLESSIRKNFIGLSWFPVNEAYRVTARFRPYDEPKEVEMLNILGDIERYQSPGLVEFELFGETIVMEPVDNNGMWFVFRDGTSGKESYPAARFLRTGAPENGELVIDFNKTYNPPCAFNPHTTCPMPVEQNRLTVRIEAGEKNYEGKH